MKEPRGRLELCRLLAERAVNRTVESLGAKPRRRCARNEMEAPAHPVGVLNHFQQRGLRRRGREPRSADRGSAPRGTVTRVGGHATAPRHGRSERCRSGRAARPGTRCGLPHASSVSGPRRQAAIPIGTRDADTRREFGPHYGGRSVAAADRLMQRFRAVEMAVLEDGGWSIARHLEVISDARVKLVADLTGNRGCGGRSAGSWSLEPVRSTSQARHGLLQHGL